MQNMIQYTNYFYFWHAIVHGLLILAVSVAVCGGNTLLSA